MAVPGTSPGTVLLIIGIGSHKRENIVTDIMRAQTQLRRLGLTTLAERFFALLLAPTILTATFTAQFRHSLAAAHGNRRPGRNSCDIDSRMRLRGLTGFGSTLGNTIIAQGTWATHTITNRPGPRIVCT